MKRKSSSYPWLEPASSRNAPPQEQFERVWAKEIAMGRASLEDIWVVMASRRELCNCFQSETGIYLLDVLKIERTLQREDGDYRAEGPPDTASLLDHYSYTLGIGDFLRCNLAFSYAEKLGMRTRNSQSDRSNWIEIACNGTGAPRHHALTCPNIDWSTARCNLLGRLTIMSGGA